MPGAVAHHQAQQGPASFESERPDIYGQNEGCRFARVQVIELCQIP
jgi:hypothetical protein